MTFTQTEKDILTAFAAAFPLPQAANNTSAAISAWEDERRAWLRKAVETLKARVGVWGTKRADQNRPPSKDAAAKEEGGRLWAFDTCVATSDITIRLNVDAHGEDITGQVFIPVDAHDWLTGSVPEPVPGDPAPVPETPDPIEPSPVLARLEAAITAFCKSWLGV